MLQPAFGYRDIGTTAHLRTVTVEPNKGINKKSWMRLSLCNLLDCIEVGINYRWRYSMSLFNCLLDDVEHSPPPPPPTPSQPSWYRKCWNTRLRIKCGDARRFQQEIILNEVNYQAELISTSHASRSQSVFARKFPDRGLERINEINATKMSTSRPSRAAVPKTLFLWAS